MTRQDASRFVSSLTAMGALYERHPEPAVIEIYFRALEKFTIDEVEQGISKACSTHKFFPKPVELIECITGGSGNLADKAMIEACRVLEVIKNIGTYSTVCFDDPVTQAVIVQQFGGWAKFSEMREENEKWFVKDFCAGYQAFTRQNVKHYGALPGVASCQNALTGKKWEERPVMIGDQEKARAILGSGKLNALPDGDGMRHAGVALGQWMRPASEHEQ